MPDAPSPPKVLLLITDAGGGHRASAQALKAACDAGPEPLDTRVVNVYREVWAKAEPLGRCTGIYGEDVYNFVLKHSLLALAGPLRRAARLIARTPNPRAVADGVAYLRRERPALCVSLMPFVNDLHARICAEAGVPLALVMTDVVDTRPFMWVTPRVCREAVWVAAPCALAASQAREAGCRRVLESGLLLHPKYHDPGLRALSRAQARAALGLEEGPTTVLLSMGGFGGSSLEGLVEALEGFPGDLRLVVACGRNEALRSRLLARAKGRHAVLPLGFTQELHRYLRAADLLAGKPGPASVFEAAAAATPMVLDTDGAMPQEVPNARLAVERGWAVAVGRRRDLARTVAELAADAPRRARMEAALGAFAAPATPEILRRAVLAAASPAGLSRP